MLDAKNNLDRDYPSENVNSKTDHRGNQEITVVEVRRSESWVAPEVLTSVDQIVEESLRLASLIRRCEIPRDRLVQVLVSLGQATEGIDRTFMALESGIVDV